MAGEILFEIIDDNYMIPSLVTDIVNIISIKLENKPVRFIVNVDPSVPNNLIGDEIRIKQILINIIERTCRKEIINII